MNLEQEFEQQKFIHKSTIVLASLLNYYQELQKTGVSIPDFMDISPEEKAHSHYIRLLANNNKFNEIYDRCWEKYGELLP